MRIRSLVPCLALLAACSKPPSTAPASEPVGETAPAVDADATARPSLSATECEAQGGTVVGDIGDGAIHRPDYRCESGSAPIGSIVADPDGPMGVEGAVCCK